MTVTKKFIACVFFLCVPTSNYAAIITYTDPVEWQNTITSTRFLSETFDGPGIDLPADTRNYPIGLLTLSLNGGTGDPGPSGLTGSGFLQAEVDSSGADALSLTIAFQPTFGFGLTGIQNDSISNPAVLDLEELAISIGGEFWLLSDIAGTSPSNIPFLGFVSDALIDSFEFLHSGELISISRTSEEFYLDGVTVALTPAPIPEPAMIALLLAGLVSLMLVRKLQPGLENQGCAIHA